ncbi:unnamed protein product, partial [Porites lobata]
SLSCAGQNEDPVDTLFEVPDSQEEEEEEDDDDDEEEGEEKGEETGQEETLKETERQEKKGYQELVRSLHCQYQDAPAANKARLHMDFTMLLLFAVNPGRGRELRTLRLLMEMPEGGVQTLLRGLPEGDNVVVIS